MTKNQILDRLIKAGHITVEELLILAESEQYSCSCWLRWGTPTYTNTPIYQYTNTGDAPEAVCCGRYNCSRTDCPKK